MRKKRRRKSAAAPGAPTSPAGRAEELNAGGRALLGREDKPRRMRPGSDGRPHRIFRSPDARSRCSDC